MGFSCHPNCLIGFGVVQAAGVMGGHWGLGVAAVVRWWFAATILTHSGPESVLCSLGPQLSSSLRDVGDKDPSLRAAASTGLAHSSSVSWQADDAICGAQSAAVGAAAGVPIAFG